MIKGYRPIRPTDDFSKGRKVYLLHEKNPLHVLQLGAFAIGKVVLVEGDLGRSDLLLVRGKVRGHTVLPCGYPLDQYVAKDRLLVKD